MSTGDLSNNIKRLQSELCTIQYPEQMNSNSLKSHEPFVKVLRYCLEYFPLLTQWISNDLGYDIVGKSDQRFIDVLYKILIVEFKYTPLMRKDQFLSKQFVERKVLMLTDCIRCFKQRNNDLKRKSCLKKTKKIAISEERDENSDANHVDLRVIDEPKPKVHSQKPSVDFSRSLPTDYLSAIEQRRKALLNFHKSLNKTLYPNRSEFQAEFTEQQEDPVTLDEEDAQSLDCFNDLFTTEAELNNYKYEQEMTLEEIEDLTNEEDKNSSDMLQEAARKAQNLAEIMQRVLQRLERSEEVLSGLE